ncbi:MAG: hypothetical protein ABIH90_00660 [Candidatus Aenigmatarchaeota archaeon]
MLFTDLFLLMGFGIFFGFTDGDFRKYKCTTRRGTGTIKGTEMDRVPSWAGMVTRTSNSVTYE